MTCIFFSFVLPACSEENVISARIGLCLVGFGWGPMVGVQNVRLCSRVEDNGFSQMLIL